MADLLAASGLIVRAADQAALARLLTASSIPFTPWPRRRAARRHRGRRQPGQIAALAMAAGLPLTELRPAGDTGLEELFLSLTSPAPDAGAPNPKDSP